MSTPVHSFLALIGGLFPSLVGESPRSTRVSSTTVACDWGDSVDLRIELQTWPRCDFETSDGPAPELPGGVAGHRATMAYGASGCVELDGTSIASVYSVVVNEDVEWWRSLLLVMVQRAESQL